MNILFLTLLDFDDINCQGIYTDLIRAFVKEGHTVKIISPMEKKKQKSEYIIEGERYSILKIVIGNTQKTNILEKGISILSLESKFVKAIKNHFINIKFDLILYSTPPITLLNAVKYVKYRDGAATYLLLKDIFPQNALDLGILRKTGIRGLIYRYFKFKEKELYDISDYIGCMSKANVNYIIKENNNLVNKPIEVSPNSIEPRSIEYTNEFKFIMREKYGIPQNKIIFVYGGNLGKPQGIDFLLEVIEENRYNEGVHFLIVGSGTEYQKVKNYFDLNKEINATLIYQLPKDEYEGLINACDVGLIFLDSRFTIPNFPSRMLSYMQAKIPILASTDINTDIGIVIEKGEFGFWCAAGDIKEFNKAVESLSDETTRLLKGQNAYNYFLDNYTSKHSYDIIMKHFT